MDYVLFGMGYGATLMLLGWALRTFGPERKYKNIDPQEIEREVEQRRWVRFIQGLGGIIAIAGTAMVLFTFIVMLLNPNDGTGSQIALSIWAFLTVIVLVWCWMYVSRYGLLGVWSRDAGYGFRKPSDRKSRPSSLSSATARVSPKPRITTSESPIVQESDLTGVSTDLTMETSVVDDPGVDQTGDPELASSGEPAVSDDAVPVSEDEPGYDFGDGADTTVPAESGGRAQALMRQRQRQSRPGNSTP